MNYKRLLIWGIVMFVLSLRGVVSSAEENTSKNLISNGNFEQGLKSWTITKDHSPEKASLDKSSFTSGKNSLKLDGTTDDEEPFFIMVEQALHGKIKPSTEYILKADIKRTTRGKISVELLERPQVGSRWTVHYCGLKTEKKLNNWEHFELKFKTNSEIQAALLVIYNVCTGGIAWIDNIELIEVKAK